MKKIPIFLFALGLCVLFGMQNVNAYPHNPGDGQGGPHPCMRGHGPGPHGGFGGPCFGFGPFFAPDQKITAEQRAKYAALLKEFEPKMREIRDQLFVKEHVLEALEHAVQPDVAKIEETAKDIIQLKNAKRALHTAFEDRVEKECGLKKAPRPLPGLDMPHNMHDRGPHHGGPRPDAPQGAPKE